MKTIIINKDSMGYGNDELGKKLISSYLTKLWGLETKPDYIIFYNSGVKLVSEGSHVLDSLHHLEQNGVEILACGTCIKFFNLQDKVKVGRISNMQEIAETELKSDTVITI